MIRQNCGLASRGAFLILTCVCLFYLRRVFYTRTGINMFPCDFLFCVCSQLARGILKCKLPNRDMY